MFNILYTNTCPCIWGLKYQVLDFYQLWCSEQRIDRPLGAQRRTLIWLLQSYWQNPAFLALTTWLIDSINIRHLGLLLFNVSDVLCIYLFRRDVLKICMSLNILHVLFLLQLTWQGRGSLKCPQIVPSSSIITNASDLKLLRGSRWAEIFWNAWCLSSPWTLYTAVGGTPATVVWVERGNRDGVFSARPDPVTLCITCCPAQWLSTALNILGNFKWACQNSAILHFFYNISLTILPPLSSSSFPRQQRPVSLMLHGTQSKYKLSQVT